MFTVCPKCALTLAITAADLRAGQGYVRCGRCANVFNALLGLSEESGAGAAVDAPQPPKPPPPEAPARASADVEVEVEVEVEEFRGTGTFETIVLEGDTVLQTEEQVTVEVLDSELADVSRRLEVARDAGELAPIPPPPPEVAYAAPDPIVIAQLRTVGRSRPGWLAIAAAALLVLLLAAQAVNHWRNDLATYTAWYAPLERLSTAVGESFHPNWDLNAYDVRQLGATADSANPRALRVRLSLANRGERSQELPLLRLTLLDRYGKAVSSGELRPAEYLPAPLRGQRFIAREQRIDTEVSVLDPSQQASSFELDVCLAASGGGLRCAGEAPVLAARR